MAKQSYKDLQDELNELMSKLQDDDLDVDAAVETYQKATKLIKELQKYLELAENKLRKVS